MRQRLETVFVVVPLALALLELYHPQPHDLFRLDLRAWMTVHYLQIVLFPLVALALADLVEQALAYVMDKDAVFRAHEKGEASSPTEGERRRGAKRGSPADKAGGAP